VPFAADQRAPNEDLRRRPDRSGQNALCVGTRSSRKVVTCSKPPRRSSSPNGGHCGVLTRCRPPGADPTAVVLRQADHKSLRVRQLATSHPVRTPFFARAKMVKHKTFACSAAKIITMHSSVTEADWQPDSNAPCARRLPKRAGHCAPAPRSRSKHQCVRSRISRQCVRKFRNLGRRHQLATIALGSALALAPHGHARGSCMRRNQSFNPSIARGAVQRPATLQWPSRGLHASALAMITPSFSSRFYSLQ